MNQPLPGCGDRKLHRIGFAVMVRNLAARAMQKLDHGIMTEVKFVRALQVDHSGDRNDAADTRFVSCEAERELTSG